MRPIFGALCFVGLVINLSEYSVPEAGDYLLLESKSPNLTENVTVGTGRDHSLFLNLSGES